MLALRGTLPSVARRGAIVLAVAKVVAAADGEVPVVRAAAVGVEAVVGKVAAMVAEVAHVLVARMVVPKAAVAVGPEDSGGNITLKTRVGEMMRAAILLEGIRFPLRCAFNSCQNLLLRKILPNKFARVDGPIRCLELLGCSWKNLSATWYALPVAMRRIRCINLRMGRLGLMPKF
jgi:hypothetical protein